MSNILQEVVETISIAVKTQSNELLVEELRKNTAQVGKLEEQGKNGSDAHDILCKVIEVYEQEILSRMA